MAYSAFIHTFVFCKIGACARHYVRHPVQDGGMKKHIVNAYAGKTLGYAGDTFSRVIATNSLRRHHRNQQ